MNRQRLKKMALFALKIAILAGLLEYARRQSQIDDEIALADVPPAAGNERNLTLPASDGTVVTLGPRTRLRVVNFPDNPSPRFFRVTTPDGAAVDIPTAEVEGSPARDPSTPARFALLPGLRTLVRQLDLGLLGLAFLAFGPPLFLMGVRWRILLLASGVSIPFWVIIRLNYLGFFFNTFMPGSAGGDIVKAVHVTRHSAHKTEAVTMVFIDRAVGLIGLLLMSGGVVLIDYGELSGIAVQVGAISATLVALFGLFFSAWFRKLVRYEAILERLPLSEVIKRVDRALYALRRKKAALAGAMALTVFLQLLEVVGISFAGRAIGLHKARFVHYLAFVPIGYLFNALPISFGGIGLMEGAYLKLFRDAGVATATQGFMLGVIARTIVIGWSLLGALSALFPPETPRSC